MKKVVSVSLVSILIVLAGCVSKTPPVTIGETPAPVTVDVTAVPATTTFPPKPTPTPIPQPGSGADPIAGLDPDETSEPAAPILPAYEAYLGLGKVYLNSENCGEASDPLLEASIRQPYASQVWVYTGLAYSCRGSFQAAIGSIEDALALNPYDPVAYYALGQIYLGQELFEDAESAYLTAIDLSSRFNETYFAGWGNAIAAKEQCGDGASPEVDAFRGFGC